MILGDWKGYILTENGNPIKTDWSKVTMSFEINGDYEFVNPSLYKEEGKYTIHKEFLLTQPDDTDPSASRKVEIIKIALNTLIIRMNDGGNEIILHMVRV